jgi:hypothetical protein
MPSIIAQSLSVTPQTRQEKSRLTGRRILEFLERLLVTPERKRRGIERPIYWVGSPSAPLPSSMSRDDVHAALAGIDAESFQIAKASLASTEPQPDSESMEHESEKS